MRTIKGKYKLIMIGFSELFKNIIFNDIQFWRIVISLITSSLQTREDIR